MLDRRHFFALSGALAATGLTGCASNTQAPSSNAGSSGACTVFDQARQASVTPAQALQLLQEGNARFVGGTSVHCDLLAQVKATATGQAPFAAVLGCMDSRVPPEMVFDQQLGDIFAVRLAGNFVNTDVLGSLEYATQVAGAKLIVVLGHSECGAVKGTVDQVQLGHLTASLANIQPSMGKLKPVPGPQTSKNKALVQALADQNTRDAAAQLTRRSEVLKALADSGKLKIVAAMHDVATGKIAWF